MGIGDSTIGLLFRIKSDATDAVRGLRETGTGVDKLTQQTDKLGKVSAGIGDIFAGSFLANIASGAITTFVTEITDATKAVFDYSARMEQTKIGFTTLLGGTQAAEKHLKELQKFAQATPFEFEGLARASRRLINVGVEADKVVGVMRDIGNAAAAAGASSAELDSITLAFSQIIAKGKLSAEEVNQLAERGIPVWRLLEEQLGKTKGEIIKLAEQGKISSDQFLTAFQKYSQLKFGDAMEKQSHTFNGAMSTIKDITLNAAYEGFKPLFNEISAFADRMTKNEADANQWGKTLNKATQDIIDGLRGANTEASKPKGLWDFIKYSLDNFDWYLRNVNLLTKAYADWADSMREAGAQQRQLQTGAPNASGVLMKLDPVTNTLVPADQGAAQAPAGPVKPPAPAVDTKELEKAQKERDDILEKQRAGELGQLDALQKAEEHVLERVTEALKKQLELRQITSKQFLDQRLADEENFAKGAIENIDKEFELKLKQGHLNADQQLALELETDNARQKIVDDRFKKEEEAKKDAAEADKRLTDEQLTAAREKMERSIELQQAESGKRYAILLQYADKEKKSAEDVARFKEFLDVDTLEFRLEKLRDYSKQVDKGSKEYIEIQHKIKLLEIELEELRAKNAVAEQKRHTDRIKSWNEYIKKIQEATEAEDERAEREARRKIAEENDREHGGRGGIIPDSGIEQLGNLLGDLFTDEDFSNMELFNELGEALSDTFGQLAEAVGASVRAFVLFGTAGGSFRKFAAELLASIAQMAAVQAVWNLAEGFAKLALAYFGHPTAGASATQHFIAAAVYGTIAGVAALAGRAVAGDSFKDKQGAANSSASGSASSTHERGTGEGQGQAYSSYGDKAYTYEEGRDAPAPMTVGVEISFKDKPDWFDDMFEARWEANGKPRRIVEDGR